MSLLPALSLLVLLTGAGEPAWQQVARDDGITVMARTPEGIRERTHGSASASSSTGRTTSTARETYRCGRALAAEDR